MTTPTRLMIVNHSLRFDQGGAELVLLELLRRMDAERFDCHLASGRDSEGVPVEFRQLGVPLHILPSAEPTGLTNPVEYSQYLFRLVRITVSFYFLLRRVRPDAIHINSIMSLNFAAPAALLAGIPFTYHEHSLPQQREKTMIGKLLVPLANRAAGVIAITNAVREELLEAGLRDDRVRTVYNGIDPEIPRAEAQNPLPRGLVEPGFRIGQVANLHTWKGHETMIHALARLREDAAPEHHYIAFGRTIDPGYAAHLQDLVDRSGLRDVVEFAGFREDVQALLARCDCMVLASDAEPFGLVLLEAMRAGIPVIASNSGGAPEIVRHEENGLLFERGDAVGLARALRRLMEDGALRTSLIEAGHRTIRNEFTWDGQVVRFMDALEHFLVA